MSHATLDDNIPTIDNTLGAMLVGALFSMSLWGVGCTQTYDYFMSDNTDGRLQRLSVAFLWVIDTFGSVMHSHVAYYYLITLFGNPAGLQHVSWSINLISVVAGISNFLIRSLFVRRIYKFNGGNIIIPAWIMCTSISEFVVVIVISVYAFQGNSTALKTFVWKLLYASFALGVTADLSVTIALCWLLHTSRSGTRISDSVVNTLMAYVVNTGLLVTVFASVGLITFFAMPDNFVFLAVFLLVSKLYFNAYLATLNARGRLRGITANSNIPISRLSASFQGRDAQGNSLTPQALEKTPPFHSSSTAISSQKTVERRVGDDSPEVEHAV